MSEFVSVKIKLSDQQKRDMERFFETCEDSQGYDIPKDRMKSLARIGMVRSLGFSRYEFTDAGDSVIDELRAVLAQEAEKVEPVSRQLSDELAGLFSAGFMDDRMVDDIVNVVRKHSKPAPVSVVLPDREHVHSKTLPFRNPAIGDGYISGWNACLDKVKELNQ